MTGARTASATHSSKATLTSRRTASAARSRSSASLSVAPMSGMSVARSVAPSSRNTR